MPIDLLDAPLRVTWDLHSPHGPAAPATLQAVAARLIEAGVFFVTLERRPLLHPGCIALLQDLRSGGCSVQLRCAANAPELAALVAGLPATLLLDAAPCVDGRAAIDTAALGQAVATLRGLGYAPTLVLTPNRDNLQLLPALFAFAREQQVDRIKLPNFHLGASVGPTAAPPSAGDLAAQRVALATAAGQVGTLALEVHDLFLWEILFPKGGEGGRGEYGGCQAANSLAHICADGTVWPCSSWPQALGSLLDAGFEELWAGDRRLQVRREVDAAPAGCVGCRDYSLCFGGCRGLSRTLAAAGDGRDLLCAGRRGPSDG